MWANKGTYGHPGGLLHAFANALGTTLCFVPFEGLLNLPYMTGLITIFVFDFVVHYHIDYFKMNINRMMEWGPTTHHEFWCLTGFDQFLHQVTYLFIMWNVLT